jgi:hypothetical protein
MATVLPIALAAFLAALALLVGASWFGVSRRALEAERRADARAKTDDHGGRSDDLAA